MRNFLRSSATSDFLSTLALIRLSTVLEVIVEDA